MVECFWAMTGKGIDARHEMHASGPRKPAKEADTIRDPCWQCPSRLLRVSMRTATCIGMRQGWERPVSGGYHGVVTVLREELHQVIDQLPEKELGPVLEYARAHVQPSAVPGDWTPVWDGPGFIGAFASGRDDVSERDEELLFTEHPADGDSYR